MVRTAWAGRFQQDAVGHAEKGRGGTLEPWGPLTQAVPSCPSQVCSFLLTTLPAPPTPSFISGSSAGLPLMAASLSGGFTLSHFSFFNLGINLYRDYLYRYKFKSRYIACPFLSQLPEHSLRPGVTSQTLLSMECKVTGVSKFKKHRAEDNF